MTIHTAPNRPSGPEPEMKLSCLVFMEAAFGQDDTLLEIFSKNIEHKLPANVKLDFTDAPLVAINRAKSTDRAILYYHTSYDADRDGRRSEWDRIDGEKRYELFERMLKILSDRGVPCIVLESASPSKHLDCGSPSCRTTLGRVLDVKPAALVPFFDSAYSFNSKLNI